MTDRRRSIVDLLLETGRAHHQAFLATNGEDRDWPLWYARRLDQSLNELLGTELSQARIAYCLMEVESERSAQAPDADWAPYYADHLETCFAPSETAAEDRLALYYFPSCGFCRLVLHAIKRLGLDVELRDIYAVPEHRDALIAARGRGTVPVLRVTAPDGAERWMPESRDIVRYLDRMYG